MAIEAITDRPPYVVFEMRDIEDRNASIAAGHYVGKEVAFATISRPGSRDTLDKEAKVWLAELKARKDIPMNWYPSFKQTFEMWEKGETGAVNGTPIKGWTMLGSAAQKTLLAAGILTVEDLASVPDQDLQSVGTGAISFKMKAKAYLEAANGPGKQAEEMAALRVQMQQLIDLTKDQAKEIQALREKQSEKQPEKASF